MKRERTPTAPSGSDLELDAETLPPALFHPYEDIYDVIEPLLRIAASQFRDRRLDDGRDLIHVALAVRYLFFGLLGRGQDEYMKDFYREELHRVLNPAQAAISKGSVTRLREALEHLEMTIRPYRNRRAMIVEEAEEVMLAAIGHAAKRRR